MRDGWKFACLGCGGSMLLVACGALVFAASIKPEHLQAPQPMGMVLRIEVPEPVRPWGNASVRALPTTPPRLCVTTRIDTSDGTIQYQAAEYDYPDGKRLTEPAPAQDIDPILATAVFDFDGDGTPDTLTTDWTAGVHTVRVLSGASGLGLFVHQDPREYEYERGAFPLGDIDGDGCAELALSHPRFDRSYYDWPEDCLWEARSWITVVSGRLACRR